MVAILLCRTTGLGAAEAAADSARLDLSSEYVGRATVKNLDASAALTAHRVEWEWLFLLFAYDHFRYDWRTRAETDAAPWGSLHRVAPGLQYLQALQDSWGVWIKAIGIAGFEDSVAARSWTAHPQVLFFNHVTDGPTLYAGAGTLYHSVDSVFYPIMGVAWTSPTGLGFSGALGFPETLIRYRFNERYAVKADFEWDIHLYRLADDNARAPGGFLRTEDRIPGLYFEYRPTRGLTLSPGVRWHLGRSVTLYDRDEDKIRSSRVDGAWSAIMNVEYRF